MHDVPFTRLALALQGVQGGHAMHIVPLPIHDASDQTFKGMHLGVAATAAEVRHNALLHGCDTFLQRFYQR
jgi:hypothetical protein